MTEISNLIFHGEKHYMSSPFGKREIIKTAAGNTSPFHYGTDYATYGKKLPQYAVSQGKILSCGVDKAYGNAKYVWVEYPSLKVKTLHYHLDEISVAKGQTVDKNTLIGITGKTGYATGIHLHLGLKRIGSNLYIDPEKWANEEYPELCEKNVSDNTFKKGAYRVTANLLNVREGAGTSFKKKSFYDLSSDAQKKILKLNGGKPANGYVKGVAFTVLEANGNWGRSPSGWVCLDYCEAIA